MINERAKFEVEFVVGLFSKLPTTLFASPRPICIREICPYFLISAPSQEEDWNISPLRGKSYESCLFVGFPRHVCWPGHFDLLTNGSEDVFCVKWYPSSWVVMVSFELLVPVLHNRHKSDKRRIYLSIYSCCSAPLCASFEFAWVSSDQQQPLRQQGREGRGSLNFMKTDKCNCWKLCKLN